MERRPGGRLRLSLPFKDNLDKLGDNKNLARSRLNSSVKKLSKNPKKLAAGDKEIQNFIDSGFAEEAAPKQDGQLVHYLPLQAVLKMNLEGTEIIKTRIVNQKSCALSENVATQLPRILKRHSFNSKLIQATDHFSDFSGHSV